MDTNNANTKPSAFRTKQFEIGLGRLFKLFAVLTLVCLLPTVALTQSRTRRPARIKFSLGAISAHVAGQFSPANERPTYVIKARAGDHLIVNIIPVTKSLTMGGTIKSPSGQGDGGPGGIIANSDLTESGDYVIEVFQHTMGSNLASGKFVLEIVITPAWLKS